MTANNPIRKCRKCTFRSNTGETVCPNDGTQLTIVPEDPMIGKIVANRYKVLSRLGRGGMSVVYKAQHQFMDRFAAIKMLRAELAADTDSLKRLEIESKAISLLKHPSIVPVYDFGLLDNDIPFLAMEYLEGKDLDNLLKKEGAIPFTRALPIFISICDGLEHAHQKGIIHRDIKPSNIILVEENDGEIVPVIVDFGIAKIVDLNGEDLNKLTATGQVFGSPLYMSPEQCSAKKPDSRSDIYSVGCVLYQALTGQKPLRGKTPVETMVKHIQEHPKPFSQVMGKNDIPTKVELCVFKALEKDAGNRFSSMQEFSDALKNCLETESYTSLPKTTYDKNDAVQSFANQLDAVSVEVPAANSSGSEPSVQSGVAKAQFADANVQSELSEAQPKASGIEQKLEVKTGTNNGAENENEAPRQKQENEEETDKKESSNEDESQGLSLSMLNSGSGVESSKLEPPTTVENKLSRPQEPMPSGLGGMIGKIVGFIILGVIVAGLVYGLSTFLPNSSSSSTGEKQTSPLAKDGTKSKTKSDASKKSKAETDQNNAFVKLPEPEKGKYGPSSEKEKEGAEKKSEQSEKPSSPKEQPDAEISFESKSTRNFDNLDLVKVPNAFFQLAVMRRKFSNWYFDKSVIKSKLQLLSYRDNLGSEIVKNYDGVVVLIDMSKRGDNLKLIAGTAVRDLAERQEIFNRNNLHKQMNLQSYEGEPKNRNRLWSDRVAFIRGVKTNDVILSDIIVFKYSDRAWALQLIPIKQSKNATEDLKNYIVNECFAFVN